MRVAAPVAPARACAYTVIRRVFEQGAYADRALRAEADDLDPRDRALATALAYGVVQRRATLDHIAAALSSRPLAKLDPPVLAALRLGLLQLLFMDGVPEHAAVNESVELAKPAGASFVNAVLRRAVAEGRQHLEALGDDDPASAAIKHSLPEWVTSMWWEELGPEGARALARSMNDPAEAALRANTLVASPAEVSEELPVRSAPASELPEGLVLEEAFDVHGSALFARGAVMPQSRGSMLVGRTLDPQPGERVLDLCAAPGGKTTHLAALMQDQGEIAAVERHPGRAKALARTCARMQAECVDVHVEDAVNHSSQHPFDRVLVDPPCSGLGTLQSRPDLRWRVSPQDIPELAEHQRQILKAGARRLAENGTLVYSVCTISRRESEDVVGAVLADDRDLVLTSQRRVLPSVEGTDGFFIARLRR